MGEWGTKVQTTTLSALEGDIINSLDPVVGVDPTKNAPSISVVNTALGTLDTAVDTLNDNLTDGLTYLRGYTIYEDNPNIAQNADTTIDINFSDLLAYERIIVNFSIIDQTGSFVLTKSTLTNIYNNGDNVYNIINGTYSNGTWYSVALFFSCHQTTKKIRIIPIVSGYSGWKLKYLNIVGIK